MSIKLPMNEGQFAVIVAIIGFITAAAQLFIKFVLSKSDRKVTESKDAREEETSSLKRIEEQWHRIDLLEKEVDIWRLKYYAEHQQLVILEAKVSVLEDELSAIKKSLEKKP